MKEQLSGLFGMYSEAVMAVLDGEIVYYNASAKRLLPNIDRLKPGDILPEAALRQESDSFVGEADIGGKKTTYSAVRLGDYTIFSLISSDESGDKISAAAFSAMSMEMKDYLTAYKTAASTVLSYVESTGDNKMGEYAAMMNKCYYSFLRLTLNMEVLGFGFGGQSLVREGFDLVEACSEIIEGCAQLTDGRELPGGRREVKLTFDSALTKLEVFADKDKLTQMLLNMISNSIRNTPAGGTISLTVSQSGRNAIIKVSDTGRGIPESVRRTAWNGFGKQKAFTDAGDGAGFGLAAVSQIARLHGGNVLFDSREGEGTTIAVSIPVGEVEEASLQNRIEHYRSGGYSPLLTGLSTVIRPERYMQKYMD